MHLLVDLRYHKVARYSAYTNFIFCVPLLVLIYKPQLIFPEFTYIHACSHKTAGSVHAKHNTNNCFIKHRKVFQIKGSSLVCIITSKALHFL